MKLTGSLCFQIRFCREETGFLFGRVSALFKGPGLLHFPAEKSRCLHGVCSPCGPYRNTLCVDGGIQGMGIHQRSIGPHVGNKTAGRGKSPPGPDTLLPVFPVVYFGGIGDGTTLRTGGRDMR
jgi:hypothetical protein